MQMKPWVHDFMRIYTKTIQIFFMLKLSYTKNGVKLLKIGFQLVLVTKLDQSIIWDNKSHTDRSQNSLEVKKVERESPQSFIELLE